MTGRSGVATELRTSWWFTGTIHAGLGSARRRWAALPHAVSVVPPELGLLFLRFQPPARFQQVQQLLPFLARNLALISASDRRGVTSSLLSTARPHPRSRIELAHVARAAAGA